MQTAIACPYSAMEHKFGMQGHYQLACDRKTFTVYNFLLWYCSLYGTRRAIAKIIPARHWPVEDNPLLRTLQFIYSF